MVETINNNILSIENTEEFDYWINYINYLKKKFTNNYDKNKYYFKNMKEQIMISCLDVIAIVNVDMANKGKKFTNKCIELGDKVIELVGKRTLLKDQDKLGHLLFAQTFWESLKNKLKLIMMENFDEKNSYYELSSKDFAKYFISDIDKFI